MKTSHRLRYVGEGLRRIKLIVKPPLLILTILALPFLASARNLVGRYATIPLNGSLAPWTSGDTLYSSQEIGQGSPPSTTLTNIYVCNDADNIYIALQPPVATPWNDINWTYTIYLDTDNNSKTGYNAGSMTGGYDDMISFGASGTAYSMAYFTGGTNQANWDWVAGPVLAYAVSTNNAQPLLELAIPIRDLNMNTYYYHTNPPSINNEIRMEFYVGGGDVTANTWADSAEADVGTYKLAGVPSSGRYATIPLDGSLYPWLPSDTLYTASDIGANGPGGGAPLDSTFTNVYVANDSTNIYVALAVPEPVSNTNTLTERLYMDTDMNPNTGYNENYWFYNGYDALAEVSPSSQTGGLYYFTGGSDQGDVNWSSNSVPLDVCTNTESLIEWSMPISSLKLTGRKVMMEFVTVGGDVTTNTWADYYEDLALPYTLATKPPTNLNGRFATIPLDGSLAPWTSRDILYSASDIDQGAPLNSTFTNVYVCNDSNYIYVALEPPAPASISNNWAYTLYLDTDMNPETGYNAGWMTGGYDCMMTFGAGGYHSMAYFTGGTNQASWDWSGGPVTEYSTNTSPLIEWAIPINSLHLVGNKMRMEFYVGGGDVTTSTWAAAQEANVKSYTLATASTNTLLSNLTLSTGGLVPAFAPGTNNYEAANSSVNNPIMLTATCADPNASLQLSLNGGPYIPLTSGVPSDLLTLNQNGSQNTLTVLVTAPNGVTTNLYTVDVAPPEAPRLSGSVSNGVLTLTWPANYIGYRLLVQTNNLDRGLSSSTNDWATVAGSTTTNSETITINKSNHDEFYRLVQP